MKKIFMLLLITVFSIGSIFSFVQNYVPANTDYLFYLNPMEVVETLELTEIVSELGITSIELAVYGKQGFLDFSSFLNIDFDFEPEKLIFALLGNSQVIAIKSNEASVLLSSFFSLYSESVEYFDIHGTQISSYDIQGTNYTLSTFSRDGISFISGNKDLLELSIKARNNIIPKLSIPSATLEKNILYNYSKNFNIIGFFSPSNNIFGNDAGEEISLSLKDEYLNIMINSYKNYLDFEKTYINKKDFSNLKVLKNSNFNYVFDNLNKLASLYLLNSDLKGMKEAFDVLFSLGGSLSINGFDLFDESEFTDIALYFEVNNSNIDEIIEFLSLDFDIQKNGNVYSIKETDSDWNFISEIDTQKGYGFIYIGEKSNVSWNDFENIPSSSGAILKSYSSYKENERKIFDGKEYMDSSFNTFYDTNLNYIYLFENIDKIIALFDTPSWDYDSDWDYDWDYETEYKLWLLYDALDYYYGFYGNFPYDAYELYDSSVIGIEPDNFMDFSFYMYEDEEGAPIAVINYFGEITEYMTEEFLIDYFYTDRLNISVDYENNLIQLTWDLSSPYNSIDYDWDDSATDWNNNEVEYILWDLFTALIYYYEDYNELADYYELYNQNYLYTDPDILDSFITSSTLDTNGNIVLTLTYYGYFEDYLTESYLFEYLEYPSETTIEINENESYIKITWII